MEVDPKFLAAWIDGQPDSEWSGTSIFGHKLRKFSLWHRTLLKAVDSPFMRKGSVALFDLRNAVAICKLKYPDSRIVRPKLGPFLMTLGLITRGLLSRRKPQADPKEPNILQKALARRITAFLEYTGDYLQEPEYTIIQPDIKGGTKNTPRGQAPDELSHASELIAWSGWSEDVVWNLPLGKASWYRAMARKATGLDVDFTTPEEKAFQAQLPESFKHGK